MGQKIIIILMLVLVLGVVIYLFQSGLAAQGFKSLGGLVKFPTSTVSYYGAPGAPNGGNGNGGGAYYTNPPGQTGSGYGSGDGTTIGPAVSPAPQPLIIATSDIPTGFTRAQLSPYFHQVRFGGVSAGSYGQITLSANFSSDFTVSTGTTVDVTGWRIAANRGGEYVPQAINLYDPSGLTAPSDIRLHSGDYVNLYSQSGPFNLRLNECIGYIGSENPHFTPQLPGDCPSPLYSGSDGGAAIRAQIANFTGACQNYLYSIGSCQVPDLNNAQIPNDDYSCINFIENNFSYHACYEAHVDDAQFLSNAVWVWMGASPLDPYHDNVYLYDRSGLLVDSYQY